MTPEQALQLLRIAATKSGTINWWDVEVHASMQTALEIIGRLVEAAKTMKPADAGPDRTPEKMASAQQADSKTNNRPATKPSAAEKRGAKASDLPSPS